MLRSMYSAISGMDSFQTQLDVIGNNIANVSTTGFKSGRVDFADVLSQTVAGASAPSSTTTGGTINRTMGGTNPVQVGLGTRIAGIQTLFTQGADQSTGNPLDVAINGDGMFTVKEGNSTYYTREGDFTTDKDNNLVLPSGAIAQGWGATSTGAPDNVDATTGNQKPLQAINLNDLMANLKIPDPSATGSYVKLASSPNPQIGANGAISVTGSDGNQYVVGYLSLATFPNYAGLAHAGDSLFSASSNSGTPSPNLPQANNTGSLQAGYLEMSNVDLTQQFSDMIVAQQGFGANSKMIGTDNTILNDILNMKNG